MASSTVSTPEMAVYCFDVISAELRSAPPPPIPRCIPDDKFPLFVTWTKGTHRRLRGCIGTFAHLNLHKGLTEYAMTSAFHDSRFDPIRADEIPQLNCGVSLLVNFEPAQDYTDWIVGVHGIRINYMDGRTRRDAVYLPEVAKEQEWDHRETIDNLIVKGGYNGHINENFRLAVSVTRFQSSKVVLTFAEYSELKRKAGGH